MGDFKEITSQEELDQIIKERLSRERAKYSDYEDLKKTKADLEEQINNLNALLEDSKTKATSYDKDIEGLKKKISDYETEKTKLNIGLKNGVPYELISRLKGTNEEEITADARSLSKILKKSQVEMPSPDNEPDTGKNELDKAFFEMAKNFDKE
ncbi:MAG: hypothetical protein SPI59_01320 [Finegoldia sp.]|nr:hypothetical protein [Finegoldia sp.]